MGSRHEWHSVKPNTLGLKVLRTKTAARRPMINNMISISPYGKPCVSEAYSILFIYNSLTLILVRVERKSLIRKTLILIRVPFVPDTFSAPEGRFSQGLETLAERNKFATKAVGIRGRSLASVQHQEDDPGRLDHTVPFRRGHRPASDDVVEAAQSVVHQVELRGAQLEGFLVLHQLADHVAQGDGLGQRVIRQR